VGLRANDETVVEGLRAVLAGHVLSDVDVFPNLSLAVGRTEGRRREFHRLYRRGAEVLTTVSLGRLVRAALAHLGGLGTPPAGVVPLHADCLLGERGAVLVDQPWAIRALSERRLERVGWHRADGLVPWLDVATGEVVVPAPPFALDAEARAELDRRFPLRKDDRPVAPGRHPLHAVVLYGAQPDPAQPWSPARRLASLANLVAPGDHLAERLVALRDCLLLHRVVTTTGAGPDDLLVVLDELAHD
jgi:hypothetical protein